MSAVVEFHRNDVAMDKRRVTRCCTGRRSASVPLLAVIFILAGNKQSIRLAPVS